MGEREQPQGPSSLIYRVSIVFSGHKSVFLAVFGLHLQTIARHVGKDRIMDFHVSLREIDTYCRSKETMQELALVLYTMCPSYYLLDKDWLMSYNIVERFIMAGSGLNMFGGWANG